jgi:hypothetical protein
MQVMISRKTPDLENKLLILFAVDELGPLTSLQLLQFLAESGLMDYITMQLALGDMLAAGYISSIPHALGTLYTLSSEGRESLSLFLHRLPHSTRTLIHDAVPRWKPRFARETQMLAEFYRRGDSKYDLRLRLMEKDAPLMDMTIILPTRDLADRYSRRWPQAAAEFYGFMMKELGDAFSPDSLAPESMPEGAAIDRESAQGCILHLHHCKPTVPAITLALALPTESMSLFFARCWEEKAEGICSFLIAKLSGE